MTESDTGSFVSWKRSPVWAYFLCCGLVIAAAAMFGFTLNRYPAFYVDEPFFNISAARWLDGNSFAYTLHSQAPHSETVWAYHGPFFFRLQVVSFKLLGVTHFACRFPSFLCAHLGIILMCLFLMRRGMFITAIVLATAWLGDRSSLQIIIGRPEGLSLFFVILSYICLVNALGGKNRAWLAGASFFAGIATGFNPAALYMGLAVCAAVMILQPVNKWFKSFVAMAVGALIPISIILLCWIPNPVWSMEQFFWYLSLSTKEVVPSLIQRLSNIQSSFGWATYWNAGLIVMALGFLLPLSVKRVMADKRENYAGWPLIIGVTGSIFSIAGIILYVKSSMYSYYLVFFTTWPVLALAAFRENERKSGNLRQVLGVCSIIICFCWLPSLLWNVTRFREAVLSWEVLDKRPVVKDLVGRIPSTADLRGDPQYFIVARDAGLNFTPLPFYVSDTDLNIPAKVWLLLSPRYVQFVKKVRPEYLSNRDLVCKGVVFDGSMYFREEYFVYGPEGGNQSPVIGKQ